MLIHDDIYSWEGFGGTLRLGSGRCRLRIYDLEKGNPKGLIYLKPIIVVVTDVPKVAVNDMTVRSCAGHIATMVVKEFNIDPHRMLWVEYYPASRYGRYNNLVIPESYVVVDFSWRGNKAIDPKWRALRPPVLDAIKKIVNQVQTARQPVPPQ